MNDFIFNSYGGLLKEWNFTNKQGDSIDVVWDNQKLIFYKNIWVIYTRTFFDSYIWTFYSDLKHNNHKEKNITFCSPKST